MAPKKSQAQKKVVAVLVIGGGLAGMTASLALAVQGFKVVLVEREKQLGGNLRNLRHTFAELDVQAYLKYLDEHVQKHQNIKVYTGTELENVEGFVGNFESTLRPGSKETKIEHSVIIVARLGSAAPGTMHRFNLADLVATIHPGNPHDINFATALQMGKEWGYHIPADIRIYGIEVKELLRFCEGCTPEVAEKLDEIVEQLLHEPVN